MIVTLGTGHLQFRQSRVEYDQRVRHYLLSHHLELLIRYHALLLIAVCEVDCSDAAGLTVELEVHAVGLVWSDDVVASLAEVNAVYMSYIVCAVLLLLLFGVLLQEQLTFLCFAPRFHYSNAVACLKFNKV